MAQRLRVRTTLRSNSRDLRNNAPSTGKNRPSTRSLGQTPQPLESCATLSPAAVRQTRAGPSVRSWRSVERLGSRPHESVHRAMWAVHDAFCDSRDFGEPVALG
jgi:hypothetical protein